MDGGSLSVVKKTLQSISQSFRRVPLFVYLYLGVLVYLYHRVRRDFLGTGTRRQTVHNKLHVELTREEEALVGNLVKPEDLTDTFESVGGLANVKECLTEQVLWPFRYPEKFPPGSLRSSPTGLLLYGPPGTGKTLLARALAKEVNGFFLEVKVESMFGKWVGDSEKNAAAVFSLAHKLGSCVIFIDEIDALLASRSRDDSTVYANTKTIFLTKWDGLVQHKGSRILMVGATNRPRALDDAILRRLSVRLEVGYPDLTARKQILRIHLKGEIVDEGKLESLLTLIAKSTEGYSGSDLKELCKVAVMIPLRPVMAQKQEHPDPLCWEHFKAAMKVVQGAPQFS